MATISNARLTPEEYLEIELLTEYKNEYLDGQVYARLGTTWAHSSIITNLRYCLYSQLRDSIWKAHASGLRVRTADASMYAYPDAMIFEGTPGIDTYKTTDTLTNPTVIFEVPCPVTSLFDRRARIEKYRSLESLKEYVLVSLERVFVERFVRGPRGGWLSSTVDHIEDSIALASAPAKLQLRDIYEDVFPPRFETPQ
jgi:Uma2 family endonuclease